MSNTVGPQADPDDPYTMASGPGYDVHKFYVRSSDGKGHSMNVQVPLSTATHGMISQLIASKAIPAYTTQQAFIRDAVIHRLRYINDMQQRGHWPEILRANPGMQASIQREAVLADLDAKKREREQVEATLLAMQQGATAMLDGGLINETFAELDSWEEVAEGWHSLDAARLNALIDELRERARRMRKAARAAEA